MASNNLSIRSVNSKLRLSKDHNKFKDSGILKTDSNINAHSQHYEHIWSNKCPGGRKCKNYETIIQLEFQVKRLTKTIEQLNKINNYFSFNVSQKEFMYKQMLKENEKIQNDMYSQILINSFNKSKKIIVENNQKQSSTIQATKSFNFNNIYDDLFEYDDDISESENHEEEEKELLKTKLEKKPLRTFKRLQTMNVRHRKTELDIDTNKIESSKNMPSINLNFGSRKGLKRKSKKVQIILDSNKFDIIGNIDEEEELRREREKIEKEIEERRKKEEEEKKRKEEEKRKKEENNKKTKKKI